MIDPTYKTQFKKVFWIPALPLGFEIKFFWLGFELRWNRIYHNKKEHYKFFRICFPSRTSSKGAGNLWEIGERFEKVKNGQSKISKK